MRSNGKRHSSTMKIKDCNKKIKNMFPEYRDLIQRLREDNPHFARLFEEHEQLDRDITQLELNPINHNYDEIDVYKRKKLKLKDEIYHLLRQNHLQSSS